MHDVTALVVLVAAAALTAGCGETDALKAATAITGGDPRHGRELIAFYGCGSCHDIPGVPGAHAMVGPPLGGVGSRQIIAGQLANIPQNLEQWIRHPRQIHQNTAMPELGVTPEDSKDMAAFLYSIRSR